MKVSVYTDGGSRGNPGIAGSGTAVFDASGKECLREIVYVVGKRSTNNVAEYHGLLRGLEAAVNMGANDVEFYMDSKLVVEQMNGRWKIKHPDMRELASKARKLIDSLDSFHLEWVPRAKNKVADKLSNDAMDAAAKGHAPGIVGGEKDTAAAHEEGKAQGGNEASKSGASKSGASASNASAGEKAGAALTSPADWHRDRGEVTRFILLRHGQTDMSVNKQYSGVSDPRLTARGEQQALAAAQAVAARWGTGDECRIDAVVSSPLTRATETAAAVAELLGRDVVDVPGLTELDFGDWEGLTFDEAARRDPEVHEQWLTDASVACPGGESLQQLHRRVRKVRRQLEKDYRGKTVLVVSHVNPIKSFLRQGLDAGPVMFRRLFLDLASLSEVEFYSGAGDGHSAGGALVRGINDIGHLAAID